MFRQFPKAREWVLVDVRVDRHDRSPPHHCVTNRPMLSKSCKTSGGQGSLQLPGRYTTEDEEAA
eukprot:1105279-Prorocentrum_lima.AAC.1